MFRIVLFLLLIFGHCAMARNPELKSIMEQIEHADSGSRIRYLCLYYDSNVHSREPGKFDDFLDGCYRIAEGKKDSEFKAYLDFYKRIRTVMLIPDIDPKVREAKMPKIMEDALEHYQSENDEHFVAICNAYIGHYRFILKEYEKSLEKLLIAEEGFRTVGYEKFPDIGKHLHGMALIFFFFKDYQKVADLMEISAKTPHYHPNMHIQRYNTLGAAYTHLKQYDKAAAAFIKTKETAVGYNDTFWIAFASRNLANIYLEKGKYADALNLYESNLKFIEQYRHKYEREYYHYILGMAKTYVLLHNLPEAKRSLDSVKYKATADTTEPMFMFGVTYQDVNYWVDFYEVQHLYHYALKDYKEAYRYSDSLYSIKYKVDSLFNGLEIKVVQNRIKAQNKQYENEKNEAKIESKNRQMILIGSLLSVITLGTVLLIRKNRVINRKNETISNQLIELSKMLEQKQVLLSELQHRVKNNLQHVISILEIQKESVNFNNIEELIRGNQNRIHSMALLHKKLNVDETVTDVDLLRYLTELAELVKESYHNKQKINLTISCTIETISVEKALPLGLIIVELVSNSMKHAFHKRGIGLINVEISQLAHTQKGKFVYTDNGPGFDFNVSRSKGLGIEIIKGLIDQLNGTFETPLRQGFELIVYFK